jgi:hypothetical protein
LAIASVRAAIAFSERDDGTAMGKPDVGNDVDLGSELGILWNGGGSGSDVSEEFVDVE